MGGRRGTRTQQGRNSNDIGNLDRPAYHDRTHDGSGLRIVRDGHTRSPGVSY